MDRTMRRDGGGKIGRSPHMLRWLLIALGILLGAISAEAQPCNPAFFTVNMLPSVPLCVFPVILSFNFGPGPGVTGNSPPLQQPGVYTLPAPPAGPGGPLFLNYANVLNSTVLAKPIPPNTWYNVQLGCCCCIQIMVTNVGGCWVVTVDKGPCP